MLLYLKSYAVFNLLFGLVMIVAPEFWYAQTPGAAETGPFNIHFVRDIGIAFSAAGIGLFVGVSRVESAAFAAAWIGMVFIGGHAILHCYEMFAMGMSLTEIGRDFLLIVLPALIAAFCLHKISAARPND